MSIKKVEVWQIVCDGCGNIFPNGNDETYTHEVFFYEKQEDAEILPEDDWIESDGQHFCLDCQIEGANKEEQEDGQVKPHRSCYDRR
jgi:hypothetical protein